MADVNSANMTTATNPSISTAITTTICPEKTPDVERIMVGMISRGVENDESLNQMVISSLKSLLEIEHGCSASLADITKVVNETLPEVVNAEHIHKCLSLMFPNVRVQQNSEDSEITYNGLKLTRDSSSEAYIIKWLRGRFKEDHYGYLSYQTVRGIAVKEIGFAKQNASLGNFLRKAFPNIYSRRSDRIRWWCGITLPEKEQSEEEVERKKWLESATSWLRTNISENTAMKEKCTVIYAAVTQYVGKFSFENTMAAVKCAFPNIVRKTIDRHAYYLGICFTNSAIRDGIKITPSKLRLTPVRQLILNDEELRIVSWVRKAMQINATHREKLFDVANMLSKKTGSVLSEKTCLRVVRKAFPSIIYRKRDGVPYLIGYEISTPFKPRDPWHQKSIDWLQMVLEKAPDHCQKFGPILELMKKNLQCVKYSKLRGVLRDAFPEINIKKTVLGTKVFGIDFREGYTSIDPPSFHATDFIADFSQVQMNDDCDAETESAETGSLEHSSSGVESSCYLNNKTLNSPSQQIVPNTHTVTSNDMKEMQTKMDEMSSQISVISSEVKALREELAKSCRQKDTLLVHLQQTLMILTQQHLQKLVRNTDTLSEQQDLSQDSLLLSIPQIDPHRKSIQPE